MKKSIYKTTAITATIILALSVSSFTLQKIIRQEEIPNNNGFAVLELFTSQGCSSCPPADAVLAKYAIQNNPSIIPLAFHVDYWNYIGWKDPFSKSEFSVRQSNYAAQLHLEGNYTPQLIINGKKELVGSKEKEIKTIVNQEIASKKQQQITIIKTEVNQNILEIEYNLINSIPGTVVNLALAKKKEFTSIKRGENSGLKQTNYNIVFDFKSIRNNKKGQNKSSFAFKNSWIPSDFIVVAYLQNTSNGTILSATKEELN